MGAAKLLWLGIANTILILSKLELLNLYKNMSLKCITKATDLVNIKKIIEMYINVKRRQLSLHTVLCHLYKFFPPSNLRKRLYAHKYCSGAISIMRSISLFKVSTESCKSFDKISLDNAVT